jgi:hypothetical protein
VPNFVVASRRLEAGQLNSTIAQAMATDGPAAATWTPGRDPTDAAIPAPAARRSPVSRSRAEVAAGVTASGTSAPA